MNKLLTIIILLFTSPYISYGQDFHKTIQRVYGFVPHKTSRTEVNKRIVQLDSLFKAVQADTSKYLPALREELIRNDNPPYFYWDGACLLLSTSKSEETKQLFIQAVEKTDMRDMDTDIYWHQIRSLSLKGYDISNLALKILDVEKFNAVIYEHVFTIDKDYCLYYLLIPLSPDKYVNKLIERYKIENNEDNKNVIIKILWFSRSCTANNFLLSLPKNTSKDKIVTKILKKLKVNNLSISLSYKNYDKHIDRLKEVYTFITDYTIREINGLTYKLRKYNCL